MSNKVMVVYSIVPSTNSKPNQKTQRTRIFFLVLGFLFIVGCVTKTKKVSNSTNQDTLSPYKKIVLPYDAHRNLLDRPQYLLTHQGKGYLYKINPKATMIYVYELAENSILRDSIPVPKFLQNKNPRITVISPDSILLYNRFFLGAYLYCKSSNKLDTLHFPSVPFTKNAKKFYTTLSVQSSCMPVFVFPYLYIKVSTVVDSKNNYNGIILKYNIVDKTGTYMVDYPNIEIYEKDKTQYPYVYNGFEFQASFTVYKNMLAIIYSPIDTMYIYNAENGNLVKKIKITSKYAKIPPRPIEKNEEGYFYATEIPHFSQFFYDPFRDVYYILVKHKMSLEVSTNQGDETFSIIVLDNQFKILKEWFFEGKKYHYHNILILPDAIYFSNTHNYVPKNEKQSYSGFNLLHGLDNHK